MKKIRNPLLRCCLSLALMFMVASCGSTMSAPRDTYFDQNVDFGMLQSVAVMPFQNLTKDEDAGERVRDVFMGMLLATEALYVLPPGEVARGISRAGVREPAIPTTEEIKKIKDFLGVDAVITGVLKEYETLRSGSSEANVISLSLRMIETQTGQVIWSASSAKGGVSVMDRLFGSGGEAKNSLTIAAIDELLDKLFE